MTVLALRCQQGVKSPLHLHYLLTRALGHSILVRITHVFFCFFFIHLFILGEFSVHGYRFSKPPS